MEERIEVTEAMRGYARALRTKGKNPDVVIAAAEWEKYFDAELERLQKAQRRAEKRAA